MRHILDGVEGRINFFDYVRKEQVRGPHNYPWWVIDFRESRLGLSKRLANPLSRR